MPTAAKPSPAVVVADVSAIIGEVTTAVQNPKTISADAVAFVGSGAGVAAELSLISNQTAAITAAAATVIIPAIYRLVAAIRSHGHARVQAAAIAAKAPAK